MSQKDKLRAGLEGLFSKPEKPTRRQKQAGAADQASEAASDEPQVPEIPLPEPAETVPREPKEQEATSKPDEIMVPEVQEAPAAMPSALPVPQPSRAKQERAGEEERTGADTSDSLRLVSQQEAQLVVFELADEHFGVDIARVESVIKLQPITVVPRTTRFVKGLTNLRGTVLPVVDLRKRFGLPAQATTKETRIVVANAGEEMVGMLVDAVREVLWVPGEDIEPPSPIVATMDSTFITGIAKTDDRMIILLDLDQVLGTESQTVS